MAHPLILANFRSPLRPLIWRTICAIPSRASRGGKRFGLADIRAVIRWAGESFDDRLRVAEQPGFQARAHLHPHQSELFERIAGWEAHDVIAQLLESLLKTAARINPCLCSVMPFVIQGKDNLLATAALRASRQI
jgi:hypothetical protein